MDFRIRGRLAWTLILAQVLGLAGSSHGSLVTVNRGLRVKKGQTAFLQEGDLQFDIPRQRDACKLEVVANEPITQRVGKLTPEVFDCHYLADEVKYVHNGCPILTQDTVKLRLYRFTEAHTSMEVFTLLVDIADPECSVIKLGPKSLEVPEFYGLSDVLDGNVLSFRYERRSTLECGVLLGGGGLADTPLPAHGQLVVGDPDGTTKRGDEPESFVPLRRQLENKERAMCRRDDCLKGLKLVRVTQMSCDDFLMMGVRYQHRDPPSPDMDYIAIRVDLRDTRSGSIYQSESAWLPVRIAGAVPNQPPRPAFMSTFILEADQFILTPLSTATLDAEDAETPGQRLVFNVTRPPAEGFLTHLADHTRPVSSFTWLDLNDMLIAYQPPNASHTARRNYQVEFEVHDFFFERSPPIVVHMSVRNAETNAPRVSWNMGLSLLEGQSRPITWDQLQIVDNDNLNMVRVVTVDGLQHGRLTVRGGKGFSFTVADIRAGAVRYHHDDSDSTADHVVFRVTDGRHHARHKFPVNVLPKDDGAPFLVVNTLLEVQEGGTALVRGSVLQAADADSSDDYVLFNVTRPPSAGELLKVPGPGQMGYPVSRFLQKDLSHSLVYYRHLGNEVFHDSFEVVLSDFHDPPNLSEPQVVLVHIEPVPDQPPKEAPGTTRRLVVKETEVVHLTRQHLRFVDPESPDSGLTYTVTTPPFYTGPHSHSDAGRLFLVESVPKFTKDASAPMLRLFTQHAVNFMKVAYMPPMEDVGPGPQQIQFVLSITNHLGITLTGICFNITVLPVDNQPPQVKTNPLMVDEGGEGWVGLEHLLLLDVDSSPEDLRVVVRQGPRHGALRRGGVQLAAGHALTLQDLRSREVRYTHDGSETLEDRLELTATDGANPVDFTLQVQVRPVNDEVPVVAAGLKAALGCAEGGAAVITAEYLHATDGDSDDGGLTWLIARQPHHGAVLRAGAAVDRFVQADLAAGAVSYRHTGLEIGLTPRHDTITFVVSDAAGSEPAPPCCGGVGPPGRGRGPGGHLADSLPVYDLQVTVFPVDSQAPSLAAGDLFVVDEGGAAPITASHLKASDVDTALGDLVVSLVSPPQYGYIENVLPSPGFEKSNMGISIASFSYRDVLDGHVNYVQSRHQRVEPTADQFVLSASDGERSSARVPFYVIIRPTNDEVPDLLARNITVREGGMKVLDLSILDAQDLDVPQSELRFSVATPPRHGSIVSEHAAAAAANRKWEATTLVGDFTGAQRKEGMTLTYVHDDSENTEDSFTVRVTDGVHALQRRVAVRVTAVNDEAPGVVRNNGLEVTPGEAHLISSMTLFAQDMDTPPGEILYVFQSVPAQGQLQLKVGVDDWVSLRAGQNCSQDAVDMNLLRYLHTGPRGAAAQDFFVFSLTDGENQSPSQHYHISLKEVEKGRIVVLVRPATVSRGDRLVLNTDVLLATDGTDRPEELQYIVTAPPGRGHLEYIRHPGIAIATFSQMDVVANLVAYVHDNRASEPTDAFQFVISNGKTTRNGTFSLGVELTDRLLPSLLRNEGLTVPQGSSILLGPGALALSDPDTPPGGLVFVVHEPPKYGRLTLAGAGAAPPLGPGANFTQRQLEEPGLTYGHDGGPALIDRFTFTAADTSGRGFLVEGRLQTEPVAFVIQVLPLDSTAPEVVKLRPLWKAEALADGRFGIFLSSRELRARDGPSRDEEIRFCVVRPLYFGYLENTTRGDFVEHCFSQADLNRRAIVYVINPAVESLSDSLEFKVSDPLGNVGPAHTLELRWSSVELAQSQYSVCEDQGAVSLEVTRQGNLAESSYVTVKVKEITATADKDFLPSASSLIQFDPGVQKRSWTSALLADGLEEAEETFRVTLETPEGAVLGGLTSAVVTLRDAGRGGCRGEQGPDGTPLLGGEGVATGGYREHGSIHVEQLPLGSGSRLILPRGDGLPSSDPPEPPGKTLRARGNPKTVKPSSVFHNGTDVVYTYHGVMSVQVEDAASPSRKGRKASVRVVSRQQQRPPPPQQQVKQRQREVAAAVLNAAKLSPHRKVSSAKTTPELLDAQVPGARPGARACVPELRGVLHFNHSAGRLLSCDGAAWRPWAPTDEMVAGQACPRGWAFQTGACYVLSRDHKATWSEANRACKERYQGHLASVPSKAQMDWLWDFSGRKPFWIGLNDRESRGRWEWTTGEPLSYTNWRRTPPRPKTKTGRRCVLVWRRAKWQIRDCRAGRGHRYVCSVKA